MVSLCSGTGPSAEHSMQLGPGTHGVCLEPPAVPCSDCESRNTKFLPCRAFPAPLPEHSWPGAPQQEQHRMAGARGQQVPSAQGHPRVHMGLSSLPSFVTRPEDRSARSWCCPGCAERAPWGMQLPQPQPRGSKSRGQHQPGTHILCSLPFLQEKTKAKQDLSDVLKVRP